MNVLILNTFDAQGGAAIATYRLHCGLRSIGVSSRLLVQFKKTNDYSVTGPLGKFQKVLAALRPHLDVIETKFQRERPKSLFSPAWLPDGLQSKVAAIDPDIVHLFWVAGGFLRIETLRKLNRPIVWTLHDMWPFTGGCHYDDECGRFTASCGSCPVLHSDRENDLSRRIWKRKQRAWKDVPIVVVATSRWLANMARSSSLFKDRRIEVIPNGIDTDVYKHVDKSMARTICNLPEDKYLIMFSAFGALSDKRKGNQFLQQALGKLLQQGWGEKVELVIVGASRPESSPDLRMRMHYMGNLHDETSQVLLYSAVDAVIAPSMQENLSNTVMESLACGTPVVAFDIGGMPDMIEHQASGYLARPFEPDDLAHGIQWVLENETRRAELSHHARRTVLERYALEKVAERYRELYQSISENQAEI